MEEMKTRLVAYVTDKLSAAPDSTAKADLIEELSENLYQRYLDLVASGVGEEEAWQKAADDLGDTAELVDYLNTLPPDEPLPKMVLDPDKGDDGQMEELLHNVEDMIKSAVNRARNAFYEVKDTVKESVQTNSAAQEETAAEQPEAGVREKKLAAKEAEMNAKEAEMNAKQAEIDAKQKEIDAAREALSDLEDTRDELEMEWDDPAAEAKVAAMEKLIERQEEKIDALEEELDELEEEFDELEEEFDELEEEFDELEEEFDELEEEFDELEDDEEDGPAITIEIKDSLKGIMKDIEVIVRDAAKTAKDAAKAAKYVAKDAADLASETVQKVSDEVKSSCYGQSVSTEGPVSAEQLKAINVQTISGDVTIRMTEEPEGDVVIDGDVEYLDVRRSEDGVLTITQGKTASSSFFFGRGLSSADVILYLPRRRWEALNVSTVSGDVIIEGDGEVDAIAVKTTSGDLEGGMARCRVLDYHSVSGDMKWRGDVACLQAGTTSGDVSVAGTLGEVSGRTISGDFRLKGAVAGLNCSATSGDVWVRTDILPQYLTMSSRSGDCTVYLPDVGPFAVHYSTGSGDFRSDFFENVRGREHTLGYGEGGPCYEMSSGSGDLKVKKN